MSTEKLAFAANHPHTTFTPETIAIAQVASVILSRPESLSLKMTYNAACFHAYNLLLAARSFQDQRAEDLAASKHAFELRHKLAAD